MIVLWLCRTCGKSLGVTGAPPRLEPGEYKAAANVTVDCADCHRLQEVQKGGVSPADAKGK